MSMPVKSYRRESLADPVLLEREDEGAVHLEAAAGAWHAEDLAAVRQEGCEEQHRALLAVAIDDHVVDVDLEIRKARETGP